jgi:Methyltransferase domain
MVKCNICGSPNFCTGPGGRLSSTGKPPKCLSCFSLERHRALHEIYLQLRNYIPFNTMSALQISEDKAINPGWFASLELSVYGGSNSIDIQNIDRLDQSYDIVICNHVLEHVKNDMEALQNLMRIASQHGFLQLSVPDPVRRSQTADWGYPNWTQHGHYRLYGKDIEEKFKQAFSQDIHQVQVFSADPVTGMSDVFFFFTRSKRVASVIQNQVKQNSFIPEVINFQKGGNAKIYQTHGWYQPEKSGTWSVAGDAVLEIVLSDVNKQEQLANGLNLSVTGLGFVATKHPQNSVQLICNQQLIAEWDFIVGDSLKSLSAFIPPEIVFKEEVLKIIFRCPSSKSPKELGISPDPRTLGFFLREIRLLT